MKRVIALGMLALAAVMLTASIASAQTVNPPVVNTSGQVPAGATAPVVRNAFMLPDMNAAAGPAIDLIAPYEDAPGPGPVNVTPYLYNTPARWMGFWAILESAGGIGSIEDVWVDVYHPDGTHKYQVHMDLVTCASLGLPTTAGTPAAGSVATGQIEAAANWTSIPGGILDQCNQGLLAVYFASGEITKDQPFGIYTYTIGATSLGGGSVVSTARQFEVLQRAGLAADFAAVNFGQINPLAEKITDGDSNWGGLPSVASVGNVWLNLVVDFDPLAGITVGQPNLNKVIDVFDVVLGAPLDVDNPLNQPRVEVDPILAQAGTSTADAAPVPGFILPSNCPTKIQFSVHPETRGPVRLATGQLGVPSGPYTGVVKLTGVSVAPLSAQWTSGWAAALAQCREDVPAPTPGG